MTNQPVVLPLTLARNATGTRRIPVLPVRDTVLFPHAVLPLTVGRESSIQLIESLGEERAIVVAAQLDPRMDAPKPTDLHTVGTLATCTKLCACPTRAALYLPRRKPRAPGALYPIRAIYGGRNRNAGGCDAGDLFEL